MTRMEYDKIHIIELLLRCIIGINDEEREKKQDVLINMTLYADLTKPGQTDDIQDTVDYKKVKHEVIRLVENSSDLDILVYGDVQIDSQDLQIPDKDIATRYFIAIPLYELNPVLWIPGLKQTSTAIAKQFSREPLQKAINLSFNIEPDAIKHST